MNFNVKSSVQLTLCILKPHVCAAPHVKQDIQSLILKNGFYIIKSKVGTINMSEAEEFYKEHIGKFFFNRLVTFMCSGPSTFQILAKENAIVDWRSLLGPTKVYKAQFTHPLSIRGLHGLTDTRNAAHGSDSTESATREIGVFFPDFNSSEWLTNWSDKVQLGQLEWQKDLSIHLPKQNLF